VATAALAKRLVPEFATLSDADVEEWIADATTLLNAAAFGVSWPHACAYFAGHLYLQAQGGAGGSSTAAGPVTSPNATPTRPGPTAISAGPRPVV